MKYNKGFAPVLILIIVLGVLAVSGVSYFAGKRSAPKNEVSDNSNYLPPVDQNYNPPTTNNNPPISQPSISNTTVVAEWKSLSSSNLFAISSKENIYLVPDFGVTLGETIDLTGDGLDEGIFGGNGGNNELSFIMVKGSDGKNFVAKQKNKDGTIYPVRLGSVGRVMVQERYELLPNEHGFYTASLSYNEATYVICSSPYSFALFVARWIGQNPGVGEAREGIRNAGYGAYRPRQSLRCH